MKFAQIFGTLALATSSSFAQIFQIAVPVIGQSLAVGQQFTVEVDQPVSQGVFLPVSVVIGLQRCGASPCPTDDNDGILGEVLFAGDYKPVRHENFKPPYQNYTFTLDGAAGFATLHVTQLFLIGAGPSPEVATRNVSLSISESQVSSAKFRV